MDSGEPDQVDPELLHRQRNKEFYDDAWRRGFEEGTRATLQRTTTLRAIEGDHGIDISNIKLLRFAIQDLPPTLELLDWSGLPLRGEIADNYSFGKSLFVYGKFHRPSTLGEPF